MKFKVVGKSLILTDYSHKITEGENSFDTVEIAVPHFHDECDLSTLSFRFSEISENGECSAVQVLHHIKCDEKYIYLKGTITSNFSAITGKVVFMLTGVNGEKVVAKFQSNPFTVSDDISLASLPNETTAEQLFNQVQLEVQKAIEATERAEKASHTPAPAEIYPATSERLGGVLSGNDISVGDDGTVTVNSVNGKTLEKSVPANAVFTDTVYTLPKATTETPGGVKADGKTIIVSEDGTISVSKVITETRNLAVQISHPNNFLIYDDLGKPSVMVAIPKFYLDEVIDGASHTVHPAFIINGIEHDIIYISKYQNIVENDRAYSLPMKDPKTNVTFDQAWQYCKNKGTGWHLMTNAEWAAIALWCRKNNTMPKGNNDYGKDISETDLPQKSVAATYDSNGKINHILTGSGPANWYHDCSYAGIADLNGNIWEWCSGLRMVNGELQVLVNNDAADWNNSVATDSALWKAITPNSEFVKPGSTETMKYTGYTAFGNLTAEHSANNAGVDLSEALCLFPQNGSTSADYWNDSVTANINGERAAFRGGAFYSNVSAGMFSLAVHGVKTDVSGSIGFRCAYYGNLL